MVQEYLSEIADACGIRKDKESNLCEAIQSYIHDQRDIEFINNLSILSNMELMELYYQLSSKKKRLTKNISPKKLLLAVFDKCIQVIKSGEFTPEDVVNMSISISNKVNHIHELINELGEEKVYEMMKSKNDELFKRYL
jgi:hypothetical protein